MATLAWNGHRHVEIALATCGSGAIVRALDPRLHPDRIVAIADDARVRMLFFDLSFMPLIEAVSPRLAAATTLIALTNRANMPVPATICDLLCYEDVIAGASDDFNWPDFDDQTIAALCRAGRATEQDSAVATLLPVAGAFVPGDLNLSSQDIVLSAIPMSHVDGWGRPAQLGRRAPHWCLPGRGSMAARFTPWSKAKASRSSPLGRRSGRGCSPTWNARVPGSGACASPS